MTLFKKIICVTLAASMIIGASGCGKTEEKETKEKSKIEKAKETGGEDVYEDTGFGLTGLDGDITNFVVAGNDLYLSTERWQEATETDAELAEGTETDAALSEGTETDAIGEMEGDRIIGIYKASIDGGEAKLLFKSVSSGYEDSEYVNKLLVDKDNTLNVILTKWSMEGKSVSRLCKLEGDKLTDGIDVSDALQLSDEIIMTDMVLDKNGNYVISYGENIIVYDKDMKKKNEINADGYFDSMTTTEDGSVVVCASTVGEEDRIIEILDSETGELTDARKIELASSYEVMNLLPGAGDYDFYYQSKEGVSGYNMEKEKKSLVLNFTKSDVNIDTVVDVLVPDSERIFVLNYGPESSELKCYSKVDADAQKNKKILTIASLYGNYELKQAALEYNSTHKDCRINMVDYGEEEDPEQKMRDDILAGNVPDIYDLSNGVGNMSVRECISRNLFEDLNPYLEKDPDISEDDFLDSAYKAMQFDKKMYFMAPCFSINTLLTKGDEAGVKQGWSYSEFKNYAKKKNEGARLFYSDRKGDILNQIMTFSIGDFVDWKNKKCHFKSQEFKDLLEVCNMGRDELEEAEDDDSDVSMLKGGKVSLLDAYIVADQFKSYDSALEGNVQYVGYPSTGGSGSYYSFANSVAMSKESENKDIAWDFMKQFMTEEYQGKNYMTFWGMPTRKDVFNEMIKTAEASTSGKDKYGTEYSPATGDIDFDGIEIANGPLTEEQADKLRAFVDSAVSYDMGETRIKNIINEEAASYFDGSKELDDVVNIIQSKAEKLMEE